jgi:hypothetical protein
MKVNVVIAVSPSNVNEKGHFIDAGVSGISGIVSSTPQQLFSQEFELSVLPLHHRTIQLEYWTDYPENGEYQKERTLSVAIVHDKDRPLDVPFFSIDSLNQARKLRDLMNEEIEKTGAYAFFHMAGPVVVSSNAESKFALNDSEIILFQDLFKVAYDFQDSFNSSSSSYKEFLEN